MDADAFGAFEEAGDIFDPATAKRLKESRKQLESLVFRLIWHQSW